MNSKVDPLNPAHSLLWEDRLQDAVDGDLSASELTALSDHLGNCDTCRSDYRQLQTLSATLSSKTTAPALTSSFDARVLAHISTLEGSLLAQAREREQLAHLARVANLKRHWRSFWRFNLGNLLGSGALLVAVFTTLTSRPEAHPVEQILQKSTLISPLLLIIAAIAVSWALRVSERTE